MLVKCTLIWIWKCNQRPNWTVKLNSAIEHHLTILCQGWEKRLDGGGQEKENQEQNSCCSIYLSPWPSVLVTGRPRLDHAGLGVCVCVCVRGVSLCPPNGDCGMFSEGWRGFLSTSRSYPGGEAAGSSAWVWCSNAPFLSTIKPRDYSSRKWKSQTGCCLLYINQMRDNSES